MKMGQIIKKTKKGNLNYDDSGRAYPDNPEIKENWNCVWEFNNKHYILIGDEYHKEWSEFDVKNQIIDEAYKNYCTTKYEWVKNNDGTTTMTAASTAGHYGFVSKEEFINKCKTDTKFSNKWGLKIEERELSIQERNEWFQIHLNGNNPFMKSDWKDYELDQQNIPTKLITITYNNETIEVYE